MGEKRRRNSRYLHMKDNDHLIADFSLGASCVQQKRRYLVEPCPTPPIAELSSHVPDEAIPAQTVIRHAYWHRKESLIRSSSEWWGFRFTQSERLLSDKVDSRPMTNMPRIGLKSSLSVSS